MLLVTKPHGQPVLIGLTGLTIEPDPISGRSIITFPTKERVSPGTLAVSQPFEHFVSSLDRAGMLIRVEETAQAMPSAAPAPAVKAEVTFAPKLHDPIAEFRQPAAEIKEAVSKNRRRKEKA